MKLRRNRSQHIRGWFKGKTNVFVVALLAVVGIAAGHQMIVFAEGGNEFPAIAVGSATGPYWNTDSKSPHRNLNYTFPDYTGGNPDTIEHVVKDMASGHIYQTKLRAYFDTDPGSVQITSTDQYCRFNSNKATRLTLNIGSTLAYDQNAGPEADLITKEVRWYRFNALGVRVLKETDVTKVPRNNARSCVDMGGEDFPFTRYNEKCGVRDPVTNYCKGADTGVTHDPTDYNAPLSGTDTNPPISSGCGGGSCKFGGRDFFGNITGYDPVIKKWFADVTVELTNNFITDPDISQQIRFQLRVHGGGILAYKETTSKNQFGLGAEADSNQNNGVKLGVPFGLPCNILETDPNYDTLSYREVSLYDVDTDHFGRTFMVVFERDPDTGIVRRLDESEYKNVGIYNTSYDSGGNRVVSTAGINQTSTFYVSMKPGLQYMLGVSNPGQMTQKNGAGEFYRSPEANVFSIRVPTDSINGLINCKYHLQPNLDSVTKSFSYQPSIPVHGYITNLATDAVIDNGGTRPWQVTKMVFDRKPANLHNTLTPSGAADPCAFMASGNAASGPRNCQAISGTLTYPAQSDWAGTYQDGVTYAAGTYICFMTSIKQPVWERVPNPNGWGHSAMSCSVSGVKPKVQVLGHDLKVLGKINTSLTPLNGRTYGSWGEYGVFSDQSNRGMASGSGLIGGYAGASTQFNWSTLTFASALTTGSDYGLFGGLTMPNINHNNEQILGGGGDYTLNSLAQLPNPLKGIYRVNGTLTINGSLGYGNNYSKIADIPYIKLIANNIVIGPGVTRIDPWLVALRPDNQTFGTISTCSDVYGDPLGSNSAANLLDASKCNAAVKFNGPVIADSVLLFRTADTASGDPAAETFDLRADNFLSSYVGGGPATPIAHTDLVKELPPRF